MTVRLSILPAFGQADLSNCEREQIHLPGSIQPHGILLVVRERDLVVLRASANAAAFLGLDGGVIGRPLAELGGDLAASLPPHLDEPLHRVPAALRCRVGRSRANGLDRRHAHGARLCDGMLHRPPGGPPVGELGGEPSGSLVIELEDAGPGVDLSRHVDAALHAILAASSLTALCDETARLVRELTGHDRVMVYRFDDEGHGEVLSEQRAERLESFLGNRYPASDIPQIARRMYLTSRVRVLADIEYEPVPLLPAADPADLDMSLCVLRSVSPIHVQYLRNMGVRGTLVVSLVVGGRLWGLISCHHYAPRCVQFEVRAVCDLLAEAVATRIAALESFAEGQAELSVRRLEQRMIEAIARDGEWRGALFDGSTALLQPLGASGAALLYEGQILTAGEVPGTHQLREIGAWLERQPRLPVFASASVGIDAPEFAPLAAVASGIVATPVSRSPGEYLVWFRPERVRTVTWGGNPFKPVTLGDDPAELSPRRSFAQWHQLVEGTCEPWSNADLAAARLIGETVTDVVLQFRSVRLLIAQDQLEQVSRQVRLSDQPVIVADAQGRVLLSNESLRLLLPPGQAAPTHIEGLLQFCEEGGEIRRRLRDLLRHRRAWRGELRLETSSGESKPLLVRADPVFSSPDRVLGFVLLFTDLTERKAAEVARRRFQDGIIEGNRMVGGRLDSKDGLMFQTLLSSVVENAQLAALEITDGVDMVRLPALLESVQKSVLRATEVLGHLIWHASRAGGEE